MKKGTMVTITGRVIRLTYKRPGPKPLPAGIKKRRVNVALSPYWHERGKEIAAEKGLSFSAFLEELVFYADSLHNESS